MTPRRQRNARGDAFHRHSSSDSLLSYRMIVGLTVTFCVVALSGMFYSPSSSTNITTKRSSFNMFHSTGAVTDTMLRHVDAIVVLGGGRPTSLDEPPIYVQRRCDDAAALVKRYQALKSFNKRKKEMSETLPILCLSAGTAHLPQLLAADGLPIWEATSSAAYLDKKHGIKEQIYVETTSYDTIGNAFFARVSHTDINGWRRLLIVTNDFHMNRTMEIFDWIFGLPGSQTGAYELHYLVSEDVGLSTEAVEARRERERASLANVREYAQTYTTLAQVYRFLTTQHGLYTATKLIQRASSASSEASDLVKKSYGAGES